jgi:acyl-CoA synthetase (AMP-forming)/AMP-acid ligase II
VPRSASGRGTTLTPVGGAQSGSDAPEIHDQSGQKSAIEIGERVRRLQTRLRNARASRVAVRIESGSELVTALLACRPLGIEPVIVSPWLPREVVGALRPGYWVRMGEDDGAPAVEPGDWGESRPAEAASRASGITIFSSGSTGVPKASRWDWDRLDQPQSTASRPERWGIGYSPFTFAAVTATCQALSRAQTIEYMRPADFTTAKRDEPFDVVAGTPSFWRMSAVAVRTGDARPRKVEVATLGGEPVDEALLRIIRSIFAPARIKQIFGTTEFGILLSVDDECPGLPCSLAGKRLPSGVAFDVADDMLRFSVGPGMPFLETGDMVRIVSGRIHVAGRVGRLINVGGHKVDPIYVSQVINRHPEVIGSRAYPVPSALLGNVVGIEVVPRGEPDPREFAAKIKSYAKLRLAPPERPRRVRITDQLLLAPSGKMSFDG